MGGYFINSSQAIFKDFFYNHQPGMAYLSAFIQYVDNPNSIAQLILSHRKFLWLLSFFLTYILYLRFGYKIILFSLLFEFSKFYVFGDRFLAENIVGYLLIYQIGVIYEIFYKKIKKIDIYLMPVFSFLIVILREPFTFATLLLLVTFSLYYFKRKKETFFVILGSFTFLSLAFFFSNSPNDYFFNVFTINKDRSITESVKEPLLDRSLKIVFYPSYFILSPEPWTILRSLIAFISASFIIGITYLGLALKKRKLVFLLITVLALSNLRTEPVNVMYFEAFHISVWLQTLIFITVLFSFSVFNKSKKIGFSLLLFILIGFLAFIFNKEYFIYEKVDTNEEFFTNFSQVMDAGTTIRELSEQSDLIFVDGYDDIVLWESRLKSSYKYNWYTSAMPSFELYSKERTRMFEDTPPDFYYGKCIEELKNYDDKVSVILKSNYLQLKEYEKRGCILIHKSKAQEVDIKTTNT